MQNILYNISQILGITIIHSLWQGLLVYFMLRFVLMFSAQLSSSKKYMLAVTSLLAITGWFIYTLINEIHIYNWLAVTPTKLSATPLALELPAGIRRLDAQSIRYYYNIEGYLPYITVLYIIGLLFNSGRLMLAHRKINTIRQTMSIDIALQYSVSKFAGMLGIDKSVKIGLSKLVDVPCTAGYFKPVILLPFTLATYLSADEIEAILLHELAHIKRNDYLINLLQQVIAILLFFNPCTQLINRIINEERENSCDDMVVNTTSNPLIYAKALLKLEQTPENELQLAMSAIGKKYYLLNRIERIMKTKKQIPSLRPALLATLILTIGISCIALFNPEIAQGKVSVKAIAPVISNLLADTGKAKAAKKPIATKTATKSKTNAKTDNYARNEYSYNYSYSDDGYNDHELERLSKEVEKYGEAINKYYNSPEFKKQSEELEQKGKEIQAFYDRPELKKLEEEQEKIGEDFQKNWGETAETRQMSKQMEAAGKKIETYYNSPGFKALNARLEKKYGVSHERNYNSNDSKDENYKKYEAELNANTPADVKQATEKLKTLGEQMSKHYNSPEFKAQSENMRTMGDSLKKALDNAQIKEQQKEIEMLSKKMGDMSNDPEIKKNQALLNQANAKLQAYINSPEFKKRMSNLRTKSTYYQHLEQPEKPEKPEKPETPEQPEKPEGNN